MTGTETLARNGTKSALITRAAGQLIPQRGGDGLDAVVPLQDRPVFARASGAVVTDVDGRDYIDFICGHGAQLLGHGDDRIIAAITKATSKGCALGETTELRVRLAELLVARFAAVDMVQFTSSRAGALREAQCLVRVHTGRPTLFIPKHTRSRRAFALDEDVIDVPLGDVGAMDAAVKHSGQVPGAVLLEPVGTEDGVHPTPQGYLSELRRWCDDHGALLVFDEAVTALRMSPGGVGTEYEVEPDLTCFGTSITGGMAAAAYGGRRQLMRAHGASAQVHMPLGDIGHEPSLAAGVALLQATAEESFFTELEATAISLEQQLRKLPPRRHAAVHVSRVGTLVGFEIVSTERGSDRLSTHRHAATSVFFRELLNHGVLFPMKLPCCLYVTSAHTEAQLASTTEGVSAALNAVDQAID